MKKKLQLTEREFDQFEDYLRHDERELAMEWKAALAEAGYRPISVNAMLAAVNKFSSAWAGRIAR